MDCLGALKVRIHDLMVEKLGEPDNADLVAIKRDAQECGLNDRQLDRLLQEVYSAINWSKVRDEKEGEDRVTGEPISIFDIQVKSLHKLGEVLFNNPERAMKYLADDVLLKANVNYLSHQNVDIAMRYAELYHADTDKDKRYLRICYRLNPRLPYRLDEHSFASAADLLTGGFEDPSLFGKIHRDYQKTYLQLWLHAQDPQRFNGQDEDLTMTSFLTLIYQIDPNYPFYIENKLFHTPEDLAEHAGGDLALWKKISSYCGAGYLWIWFNALGHPDWQASFERAQQNILKNDLLDDQEKEYASVQELFYLIDPAAPLPLVTSNQQHIERLSLPATKPVVIPIRISLTTVGFVMPQIRLKDEFKGLHVDQSQLRLFNLTGQTEGIVSLQIDPQQLDKNTEYQTALQIITPYEVLDVPIRLKIVFPLLSFGLYVLKYGAFGAVFFGFFRWLLAAGTGHEGSLGPFVITTEIGRSLPDNYPVFYWVFVAMMTAFVLSVLAVRKVEKI